MIYLGFIHYYRKRNLQNIERNRLVSDSAWSDRSLRRFGGKRTEIEQQLAYSDYSSALNIEAVLSFEMSVH